MDSIPPDVAKKLLNRDFANLVKRVQGGGKISRTERAMLQSMAAGAGGDGPAFVRNFVELATALKVTRQTIAARRGRGPNSTSARLRIRRFPAAFVPTTRRKSASRSKP